MSRRFMVWLYADDDVSDGLRGKYTVEADSPGCAVDLALMLHDAEAPSDDVDQLLVTQL